MGGGGGFQPDMKSAGIGAGLIAGVVALIWLGTGFFIVQEGQQAVITQFGRYKSTVGAALEGTTFGVGMELMASGHLRTAVLHLDKSNRPPVTEVRPLPDESASARRALAELLDRHQVTGLF